MRFLRRRWRSCSSCWRPCLRLLMIQSSDFAGIRIHIPTPKWANTPRIQQTALDIRLHHALAGLDRIVDEVVDRVGGVEDAARDRRRRTGRGAEVDVLFVFFDVFVLGGGRASCWPRCGTRAAASFMRDALAVRASSMSGVISSGIKASCTPSVFFFRDIESP